MLLLCAELDFDKQSKLSYNALMLEMTLFDSGWIWVWAGVNALVVIWFGTRIYKTKTQLNHLRILVHESTEATKRLLDQTWRDLFVIRNAVRRLKGEKTFQPDMTMKEVFASDQRVSRFLAKHRRSGIIRMEFDYTKTLRETADQYDIELEGLLKDLNGLE